MTVGGGLPGKGKKQVKALLIDLDDTLYQSHGVDSAANVVRRRIQEYMHQRLGIPADDVERMTQELYLTYGTTCAGLCARGHKIDYDDWHRYVHHEALDYDKMIKPDAVLRDLLCSIDLPKYVLTNADRKHAHICLDRMGISDCFQGIYDFEWIMASAETHGLLSAERPLLCKPAPQVYQLVLEAIKCEPSQVIFFDDSVRNIKSAHEVGITTVLVGTDKQVPGSDYAIPTMHQLPNVLPELLDQPGLVHDDHGVHEQELVSPALEQVAVAVSQ